MSTSGRSDTRRFQQSSAGLWKVRSIDPAIVLISVVLRLSLATHLSVRNDTVGRSVGWLAGRPTVLLLSSSLSPPPKTKNNNTDFHSDLSLIRYSNLQARNRKTKMSEGNANRRGGQQGHGFQNWDKDELREVARKGGQHSHGGGRGGENAQAERGLSGSGGGSTENRGFAAMNPEQQEEIARQGGLTSQAHRHGFESIEQYEKAKLEGKLDLDKGSRRREE